VKRGGTRAGAQAKGRAARRATAPPRDGAAVKAAADPAVETDADAAAHHAGDAVSVSNLSLHELFEQQAREMLDRADLDEEQKQAILVAMACPCCGAGGMSYSFKLKPRN
jgi:hypothetical protein